MKDLFNRLLGKKIIMPENIPKNITIKLKDTPEIIDLNSRLDKIENDILNICLTLIKIKEDIKSGMITL